MTSLSKARRSSDLLKLNFQHSLVARIECLQTSLYVVTLSTCAVIYISTFIHIHLAFLQILSILLAAAFDTDIVYRNIRL